VTAVQPGFTHEDIVIPSNEGTELYHFDIYGRHLWTVDALTGTTVYVFGYDDRGLLTGVEDADGNTTTIERDADGTAVAIVAPFGQRTALNLNSDGYLETVCDPVGSTYTATYLSGGLLDSLTDARDNASHFTYNEQGRLSRDEDADGGFIRLERTENPDGYEVVHTTALNRVTRSIVENRMSGEQFRTRFSPDGSRSWTLIGTEGGREAGQPCGMTIASAEGPDPRFDMQAPVTEELSIKTPAGRTCRITTARDATLADPDDPLSLQSLTDTLEINGQTYTGTYDVATRTTTNTTPEGRQTLTISDERGQPVEIQVPGLEFLTFDYDDRGRVERTRQGTRETSYSYDSTTGFLESFTNALADTVSFVRDPVGRVTGLTLPDGVTWGYERDTMGNLTVLTEPDGTTRHRFTFTKANFLETYESPLGAKETLTYDKDKGLVGYESPSGKLTEWIYSDKGQLVTMKTPEGDHTYAYDPDSEVLSRAISADGQQVDYFHDGTLLTTAAWSNVVTGSIAYRYNTDFRTIRMDYAGTSVSLSYDNDGLLTGVGSIGLTRDPDNGFLTQLSDGDFEVAYKRDNYGELSSVTVTHGSTLYKGSFTYDPLSRISQEVETIGGETHTYDYEYDSVGQLTTVKRDGVEVESYAYNSLRNRVGINNVLTGRDLTEGDFTYDADNKLLQAGETSYSYDADGRLYQVTEGTSITTYHYNTDGTLAAVDSPDGRQISYLYDDEGRRISRDVDGVRTHAWLYGEWFLPLAEYNGSGELRTTFLYAGFPTPVAMTRDDSRYHVVSDPLGSPRLVVDNTGAVVKHVDYDAFGNVLNDTNPDFDLPFGFAGGMSDPDHELVRFGARDYQPSTGRWTAKDPILFLGGLNLYRYAGNDPVNRADRAGLQNEYGKLDVSRNLPNVNFDYQHNADESGFPTVSFSDIVNVEESVLEEVVTIKDGKFMTQNEYLADEKGTTYAEHATYYPPGLQNFLKAIKTIEQLGGPLAHWTRKPCPEASGLLPPGVHDFLNYKHPPTAIRIEKLETVIKQVTDPNKKYKIKKGRFRTIVKTMN
jgi:RHS repeat-associated protein